MRINVIREASHIRNDFIADPASAAWNVANCHFSQSVSCMCMDMQQSIHEMIYETEDFCEKKLRYAMEFIVEEN